MKAARIRLIAAAILMASWLGFLGYLALDHVEHARTVVSHSQLLVATSAVKAQITIKNDGNGKPVPVIMGRELIAGQPLPDGDLVIDNLGDARLPGGKPLTSTNRHPTDTYVLLLERSALGSIKVASAPGSPGADPRLFLVYPWSDDVERQVREQIGR